MTVSASTCVPGQTTIFSTRPSVLAGIQRICSGTSVPRPRTWRTIGPRFTVSIQTVERSTLGTAGLSRESSERHEDEPQDRAGDDNDPALALLFGDVRAWDIHGRGSRSKANRPHNSSIHSCFRAF